MRYLGTKQWSNLRYILVLVVQNIRKDVNKRELVGRVVFTYSIVWKVGFH